MRGVAVLVAALVVNTLARGSEGKFTRLNGAPPAAAQYVPLNPRQTLVFLEAENFTSMSTASQWEPRAWAKTPNYFASTVANVFHSRRAYLHHAATADSDVADSDQAAASLHVPSNGQYTVLVRYEAPYRFEVPFMLNLTQNGKSALSRVYGRRSTPKVWGFASGRFAGEYDCGPGLNSECAWPWGATENMVWEFSDTVVLTRGAAVISLTPVHDSQYCCWGDINIDAVMLNPNRTDVESRVNDSTVHDLPFDGMFSQLGEVFFRITNFNSSYNLSVGIPLTYDHAIERGYRKHLNGTSYRSPAYVTVLPQGKTGWIEVGGWMDTLQHGSWQVTCDALAHPSSPPPPPPPPSPPPTPSAQELQCYNVVKQDCSQKNTSKFNYTMCLNCMKEIHPCPTQCMIGTRCQGLWFELACHSMAPPRPPPPPKPIKPSFIGSSHCLIEIGVKEKPFDPNDSSITILEGQKFDSVVTGTEMLFDVNTRATKRMRHNADDFFTVYEQLVDQGSVHGSAPQIVPIYASTFPNGSDTGPSGSGPPRNGYADKQRQLVSMFCSIENSCLCDDPFGCGIADHPKSTLLEVYVLSHPDDQPAVEKLIDSVEAMGTDSRSRVTSVKLGDEIGISSGFNDSSFQEFCKQHNKKPADLNCTTWENCPFLSSFENASSNPTLWYWSQRFDHVAGLLRAKAIVDRLRPLLPNARLGANWAPTARYKDEQGRTRVHHYIGWTFQWINSFRSGTVDLPWSEDWIWQSPVGTQQMMALSIDAMHSGMRWANDTSSAKLISARNGSRTRLTLPNKHTPMMMYVMKHYPGNTNNSWERQLFADLAHGVDRVNLFHLVPSTSGYTCDYVDSDGGAYPAVRVALNALGTFEDIVATGVVNPHGGAVALLYSESADIWLNSVGSMGAGLRSLYILLRHAGIPVLILTEEDLIAGRLAYVDMLVVTVPNVCASATQEISSFVKGGGTLLATASGGLLNEFNESNSEMESLLGVQQFATWRGIGDSFNGTVDLIKQDLQFVETLDTVSLDTRVSVEIRYHLPTEDSPNSSIVSKGVKSLFRLDPNATVETLAYFGDNSPAAIRRKVGMGQAMYLGFLPGLSYFDPAIPLRPVDRGSTDENFNHFLPTSFASTAKHLVLLPLLSRLNDSSVVPVRSTNSLVEVGMIISEGKGVALPVINWAGESIQAFTVTLAREIVFDHVTLARGGTVSVSEDRLSFTFDLIQTADAIVLRNVSTCV